MEKNIVKDINSIEFPSLKRNNTLEQIRYLKYKKVPDKDFLNGIGIGEWNLIAIINKGHNFYLTSVCNESILSQFISSCFFKENKLKLSIFIDSSFNYITVSKKKLNEKILDELSNYNIDVKLNLFSDWGNLFINTQKPLDVTSIKDILMKIFLFYSKISPYRDEFNISITLDSGEDILILKKEGKGLFKIYPKKLFSIFLNSIFDIKEQNISYIWYHVVIEGIEKNWHGKRKGVLIEEYGIEDKGFKNKYKF